MSDHVDLFYNDYDEDGRLLSRHGQVEFLTTMRYVKKYLTEGMRVLEIGAGTGIYSHTLARQGYCVDAIELNSRNIDIFKSRIKEDEKITILQGNSTDLSRLKSGEYDVTLLLGPMYHLFTESDKTQTLAEALRVTKKGGIVFASYCITDASIVGYGFRRENIADLIGKGLLDTQHFIAKSNPENIFSILRKEDIDCLMSRFNVERLHYVATDLFTNYMSETVDSMDDDTFDIYLKYHFCICERADMIGITHHSLDVFRKL